MREFAVGDDALHAAFQQHEDAERHDARDFGLHRVIDVELGGDFEPRIGAESAAFPN